MNSQGKYENKKIEGYMQIGEKESGREKKREKRGKKNK